MRSRGGNQPKRTVGRKSEIEKRWASRKAIRERAMNSQNGTTKTVTEDYKISAGLIINVIIIYYYPHYCYYCVTNIILFFNITAY